MENKNNVPLTNIAEETARKSGQEKAEKYLNEDFPIRNSWKELMRLFEKNNLSEAVLRGQFSNQSIANWKNGQIISRESCIKIMLMLNIDLDEAENFMMNACWHDYFYPRSYKDIIYRFCLENKSGVGKAEELIKKYDYLDKDNADAGEVSGMDNITAYLNHEYEKKVAAEEDLDKFFIENQTYFGNFHRAAYDVFMEYCVDLGVEIHEEREVFLSQVGEKIKIIPDTIKKAELNLIQRIILKDSPNKKELYDIRDKKKQVPRKYLILLFLATYGETPYDTSVIDLNDILNMCGMPRLDSRNPFDWIIMNSFAASEREDFGAIDNLHKVAVQVFGI